MVLPHWEMLVFAAAGAFALWMRLRFGSAFERGSDQFMDGLQEQFRLKVLIHLVLFVTIGAGFSVILVEPNTYKQALAAGMAWTSLIGAHAGTGATKAKSNAKR